MTTTFDKYLLQRILGITISQQNIFWGSASLFSKQNIKIEMKYFVQYFKNITDDIISLCKDNTECKAIVIASTAKKATDIQHKLDNWLDKNQQIQGDTCLVVGNLETELKFASTTAFTYTNYGENGNDIISTSKLSPQFLIGTPGYIGAELDCN